jgi:hypothetical protein
VKGVLVALAAVCGFALAGCTGGSVPVPAAVAATQPAGDDAPLAAGLLTVSDLPLGFQAQDGAAPAAALGCAGIDGVYLPAGSSAHAAVSFAHSLSEAFVNETISRRADAATALDRFRTAARDCARFAGPDGTAYRVSVVSLPSYGDGSAAVRVTSGLTESREVELAAVRVGDLVVAIAAAGTGDGDAALTRTILTRALTKLDHTGR